VRASEGVSHFELGLDLIQEVDPLLDAVERGDRRAAGRARRSAVKRSAHSLLPPRPEHFDLISTLARASEDRIPALVPIRHFRMATSPFAFFRGTANIMAADLAATPVSGMEVQLSGDAHCANFGAFATPERNTIFDVRDFDETLRGPWEWDVKRLAASLVLANRDSGGGRAAQEESVRKAVAAYRGRMHDFASMSTLDVWYSRIDVKDILDAAGPRSIRKKRRTYVEGIGRRTIQKAFDDMTHEVDGRRKFVDEPPLVYHPDAIDAFFEIETVLANFRRSLSPDIQLLLDRYRLVDWVVKVVGVGSVGTRCAAALLMADDNDPLILQIKEAGPSVLEEFLRPSPFRNHAERVVAGQRTMQAASDMFLGWTHCDGRDYYVRQLRDMKGVPDLEDMGEEHLTEFAAFCGSTLANAHARSGQAAHIAGYLGHGEVFDEALTSFAGAYADRVEEDHRDLVEAIARGRLEASAGS
jgi:uncharacterized protein (DUF2252 family)